MGPASRQHWGGLGHGAELSPPHFVPCSCKTGAKELGSGERKQGAMGVKPPQTLMGTPIMETGGCREPFVSISNFGALLNSWGTVG